MARIYLAVLLAGFAVAAPPTPREHAVFTLISERSDISDPRVDIPEIQVAFTNGITQRMILEHYNAIPNSDMMDHSKVCSYTGHLEGDEIESNVAVTGCLWGNNPDEKMFITVLSKHSPLHKSFSLGVDGTTQHIVVDDDDEYPYDFSQDELERADDSWHEIGGDAFMNDDLEVAAKQVGALQQSGIPSNLKLKIRIGYDLTAKNAFPDKGYQTVDDWMNAALAHFIVYYKHHTLHHKLHFEVVKQSIPVDETLQCCNSEAFTKMKEIIKNHNDNDVDMYLFFTDKTTHRGGGYITGKAAGIGGACDNVGHRKYSLTYGPSRGVIDTAETLVHEAGHVFGMFHDFNDDRRGAYTTCRKDNDKMDVIACSKCDNYQSGNRRQPIGLVTGSPNDCCNGLMGYYGHPTIWSGCSSRFFQQHYVAEGWDKCMDPIGPSPATTPAPATTAPPPPATTAPPPPATDNWNKLKRKHCFRQKYGKYNTIAEAKSACSSDPACEGIYDKGCDAGAGDIYLCPYVPAGYSKSGSSCIYEKPVTYIKMEKKHCWRQKYGRYNTISDAKLACSSDAACTGVYDKGCDAGANDIYLCGAVPGGYSGSGSSCIYEKQD